MKNYKKTFLGSVVAFFVGTSCCWMSSLAIWLGGAAFLGAMASVIEDAQIMIIGLAVMLLVVTLALLFRQKLWQRFTERRENNKR